MFTCENGGALHLIEGVGGEGLRHLPEDGGGRVPTLTRAGQGQVTLLHTLHHTHFIVPALPSTEQDRVRLPCYTVHTLHHTHFIVPALYPNKNKDYIYLLSAP